MQNIISILTACSFTCITATFINLLYVSFNNNNVNNALLASVILTGKCKDERHGNPPAR